MSDKDSEQKWCDCSPGKCNGGEYYECRQNSPLLAQPSIHSTGEAMSDLIERLGKLQDSCTKQELYLLDSDYVWELAGKTADEIERLTTAARKDALRIFEAENEIAELEAAIVEWNSIITRFTKVMANQAAYIDELRAGQSVKRWMKDATYPVDGYCGRRSSKAGLQAGEEEEEKEHLWRTL